jgi:hypothetical protein
MNKVGFTNQVMIILILLIVFTLVIGGVWIMSIAGPIIVGEGTTISNQISSVVHQNNPGTALDNATTVVTNTTTSGLGTLELLVFMLTIGLFLGYLVICYYVRTYQWLSVLWIGIIFLMVVMSFIFSNAYQQVSHQSELRSFYTSWTTMDYLMNYLPHITIALGIISGILLFTILVTEPEQDVMGGLS